MPVPHKAVCECTSNALLFHGLKKKKKKIQQGNPGRYFLPAGAVGTLLLIELLIDYSGTAIKID